MDFSLSDEQKAIKELSANIFNEKATTEHQIALEKNNLRFDANLWEILADAGLLGVAMDESLGGMGFGLTELSMLMEEAGRVVAAVPLVPVTTTALLIQEFASDELKQSLLPAVVKGEQLITSALLERRTEDITKPLDAVLVQQGDGYVLNGEKLCVPLAKQSAWILVPAKTALGTAVVLVSPTSSGVALSEQTNTAKEPQYCVTFNNVEVASTHVLADGGDRSGAEMMQWLSLRVTALYCAMMTGVCDKMMRMTGSYTSERHQFGVPVATFQAVGHRMANCYIDIEAQRLVTQQVISFLDDSEHDEQDTSNAVSIAKIWSGDCGHRVSYAAQHCHGGTGIDKDYPLWRYCLWARHIELLLGSSSQQLALLGDTIAAGNAYVK